MSMFFLLIITVSVCSLFAANQTAKVPKTGLQRLRAGLGVQSQPSSKLPCVDSDDGLPPTTELAQRQAGPQRPHAAIRRGGIERDCVDYDADEEDNVQTKKDS